MKIGVDIRVLMDENYSGVSLYTANLLKALWRLEAGREAAGRETLAGNAAAAGPAAGERTRYNLFYNSWKDQKARLEIWERENARVIGTRFPNKIFNYGLQKIFRRPNLDEVLGGTDVFWSPHLNFTRLSAKTKAVLTVHDLSFWREPRFFSGRKNFWHRALAIKDLLKRYDRIVAVSENTKNDLMELAGVPPEKIRVIYAGNNLNPRTAGEEAGSGRAEAGAGERRVTGPAETEEREFFIRHGLGADFRAPFILYLGTIEPRKNIAGLIEAYEIWRNSKRPEAATGAGGQGSVLKLILAGAAGWKTREIYKKWRRSSYKNDIKFLGYISEKEKKILYRRATVFVYPSFYEGFGFPPLEAMAFSLPVIAANVSSLPEVVGDAALMVNPYKPEEIAQAFSLLLNDEVLRQQLISRGLKKAAMFSWDKTARAYRELFANLAK